jgi:NADH-quinone oxidoreductase subunit N
VDPTIVNALTGYLPLVVAEAILAVAACVLFVGGTWKARRNVWGMTALAGIALAGVGLAWTVANVPTVEAQKREIADLKKPPKDGGAISDEQKEATAQKEASLLAGYHVSPLLHTRFALLIKLLALAGGVALVLVGWDEVPDEYAAEYHGCLLLIVAGTALTGAANDLITLFLSLELISIPTYVLLYLPRSDSAAQEAAVKYFLLSVFSSALLLFGFSYLYGLTGSTNLTVLNKSMTEGGPGPVATKTAVIAVLMVVAGLGFRIAAVPFHFYAPDVYQGTSLSAAALLAYIPKVAGFAALVRLLVPMAVDVPVGEAVAAGAQVPVLLWIMAAVTMTLGNVLALLQNNLKRMLAYSSVAHAGYMLIGLAVVTRAGAKLSSGQTGDGVEAVLFYLAAYGAMTIGAFAVLSYLSTPKKQVETIDDVAGLARTHPGLALLMGLFLFSLIGMPATAGFWGKWQLFWGALNVPYRPDDPKSVDQSRLFLMLAVIGAINAAIGAWYYLRVIAVMYLRDALEPLEQPKAWAALASIWLCALVTLGVGIYPNLLKEGVESARPPAAPIVVAESENPTRTGRSEAS